MTQVIDEKAQAQEELLKLIKEYEDAGVRRRAALSLYDSSPSDLHRETYQEKLHEETQAGTVLTRALKRMNTLEGKKPFAEREVLGAKWRPSRGNLPHRY